MSYEIIESNKELKKYRQELQTQIEKQENIMENPNNSDLVRKIAENTLKKLEKRLSTSYPSLKNLKI